MRKLLLAALFTSVSAYGAMATDTTEEAPASFSWTGAYIGGQIGYGWGDAQAEVLNIRWAPTDLSQQGFFGGAFTGYNFQLPSGLIIGGEADINLASIGATNRWNDFDGSPLVPEQLNFARVKWTAGLRGRVGYAFDRYLLFVGGGLAIADVHMDDLAKGIHRVSLDKTLTGWTIGAGVDYAFSNNVFGRLEYRYSDFGKTSTIHNYVGWEPYAVDLKTHDIRLGIAYKF